jgi:hypothetical protein
VVVVAPVMADRVVSLREAAAVLQVPLTSLRRIVEAEPTLRACVRPAGPRRPAAVDLPAIVAAWQRIERSPRPGQSLSPRQELALQRRRRLWWHGTALLQELRDREAQHVEAAAIARMEALLQSELHAALAGWLDQVAPLLPRQDQQAAQQILQQTIHALLVQCAGRGGEADPAPSESLKLSPPDPLPSEEVLRARVEGTRADLHQLQARAAAGELLAAAEVMARGFDAMRQRRDALIALAPRFAPAARNWRSEAEVRAKLWPELQRIVGVPLNQERSSA